MTITDDHPWCAMTQATIPAAEFKTHCLKLLDQVAATGQPLTVTKHGRAVARLVPLPPQRSLFGALAGSVTASSDLVAPLGVAWAADAEG